LSDRTPSDEPISYEPTAELRPEDNTVTPLGTEDLGTPGSSAEDLGDESRPVRKPIVISSTPEPSSLIEARRQQAQQRIDDRREDANKRKGGAPLWVWIAAGLVVLLLAIMFFASRGSDDTEGSGGAGTGTAGVLEADGVDLFSLGSGKKGNSGDARELEGETVSGQGVKVQSVVSDEGFWVGSSEQKRFFVFLDIEGESGEDIRPGALLDFSGELRPLPFDFKKRFALGKSSDAGRLRSQGLYLELTEAPTLR